MKVDCTILAAGESNVHYAMKVKGNNYSIYCFSTANWHFMTISKMDFF